LTEIFDFDIQFQMGRRRTSLARCPLRFGERPCLGVTASAIAAGLVLSMAPASVRAQPPAAAGASGPGSGQPTQPGQLGQPPPAEAPETDRPQGDQPTADERADEPADDGQPAEDDSGEVIVIDSRSEKPLGEAVGAVDVIDRASIRARGARNVGDALRGRVGLQVVPALRGTEVRAQGLDPEYVLILVDGLPAIGRINGAIDVDRLPVDGVERIEVVKGPSSALYGSDALGGVINVVTREADRPLTAEASALVGSRDRVDASAIATGRREVAGWRLSSRAALGMRRSDAYDLDPATAATDGSSERAGDAALRVAAERGAWRIAGGGDYVRQDLRGVDAAGLNTIVDRRTVAENGAGTLSASFQPRVSTTVTATLRHSVFHDRFTNDERESDEDDQVELTDERMTSAALVASSLVHPAHLVAAGVDGSAEGLSAERLTGDGSRERLGIYAQDEWMLLRRPQLIVTPGARLDLDTQFGVHGTPKLAARWDVTDRVIARASGGLGYRAPDFRQLLLRFENTSVGYRVDGNPDLAPETSLGGTLSLEVEPIERISVAAQGYWNEIDDLIIIDLIEPPGNGQPARYQYANSASARTRGVELQARARLGRRLVATVGYTLTDTLDRDLDRELPDRARHRGSFELRASPFERLTLATHGELVGKRSFFANTDGDEEEERIRTDRYAQIGARAELDIIENLSVFAGVDNITDAGETQYLPIAPRAFYAGLRGHYESAEDPARNVPP
jgi:outer membrane receptor for ferrienterochelin and colicins